MAYIFFRGQQHIIPEIGIRKRLRSGSQIVAQTTKERLLQLMAPKVELTYSQLQKHALFFDRHQNIVDTALQEGETTMHLSQICSICQINKDCIGSEYDDIVFTMFCGHTLHRSCFEQMAEKTCPLCRDRSLTSTGMTRSTSSQFYSVVSTNPTMVTPLPTYFIPRWNSTDNAVLKYPYTITDQGYTARPTNGMQILQTEPFTDGFIYKFSILMSSQPYCAASVICGENIEKDCRDFGRDFQVCPTLHSKIGSNRVDFLIDMVSRQAKCTFHGDRGHGQVDISLLPGNVFVAMSVKYQSDNCFARIIRTE